MANGAYHALANDTDESSLDLYQGQYTYIYI